jgi:hypothetical protein
MRRIASLALTFVLALGVAACNEQATDPQFVINDQGIDNSAMPNVCPNEDPDGINPALWTKVESSGDPQAGSFSGGFGTVSWSGTVITVTDVKDGWTVEMCVKSATNRYFYEVVGPETGTTITIPQDVSHLSWRVTKTPEGDPEFYGCSPGYWKNARHEDADEGRNTWLTAAFDAGDTWLGAPYNEHMIAHALDYRGGMGIEGARRITLRHAAAAFLNITYLPDGYAYQFDLEGLSTALYDAWGNRVALLALAAELDAKNNAGCPIDNHGNLIVDEM